MPFWDPPKNELGVTIDPGYFSTDGELYDRSTPSPAEMDYMVEHDSQVQALDLAISLILQSAPFDIEEAPGDKGEAAYARDKLFKSPLAGGMTTPMRDVLSQMDDAISRKRVYFELVWKLDEKNDAVYHKVAWRPPWQCVMKVDPKNGSFDGFEQRFTTREKGLQKPHFKPADRKAFVYIFRNYKRPLEGYSIFQTAYGDYIEKLKANRLHNVALEKFALGTVIGTYKGRLKGMATKFFNKLKDWRGGGGVMVLGDSEEVRIERHDGAGAAFLEKIRYLDSQMAGSVLLGFLLLANPDNSGAWALSKDHRDFFVMLMEAINRDKANACTMYVVAPLVEAKFGKGAAFPTFVIRELSESRREYAAEVWKTLIVAANRPQGAEWDAIQTEAYKHMGIDLAKLREEAKEKGDSLEDTPGSIAPGLQDAEAFRKSVEALLKPPAPANTSTNGSASGNPEPAANGNGTR